MERQPFTNITAKTQTNNQQTRKKNTQGEIRQRFSAPGFLKKNVQQEKTFNTPGLNISALSKEIKSKPGYLGNNVGSNNNSNKQNNNSNKSSYENIELTNNQLKKMRRMFLPNPNIAEKNSSEINNDITALAHTIRYNNLFTSSNDPVEALNNFVKNARKTRRNVERNSPNIKYGKTFMLRKEGEDILAKHKQYLHYHGKNTRVQQFKSIMKDLQAMAPNKNRSAQEVAINRALKSLEGGKRKSRKHRK